MNKILAVIKTRTGLHPASNKGGDDIDAVLSLLKSDVSATSDNIQAFSEYFKSYVAESETERPYRPFCERFQKFDEKCAIGVFSSAIKERADQLSQNLLRKLTMDKITTAMHAPVCVTMMTQVKDADDLCAYMAILDLDEDDLTDAIYEVNDGEIWNFQLVYAFGLYVRVMTELIARGQAYKLPLSEEKLQLALLAQEQLLERAGYAEGVLKARMLFLVSAGGEAIDSLDGEPGEGVAEGEVSATESPKKQKMKLKLIKTTELEDTAETSTVETSEKPVKRKSGGYYPSAVQKVRKLIGA